MSRPLLRLLSLSCFIVVVVLLADLGELRPVFRLVSDIPFGDKVLHALFFGGLAFLAARFASSLGRPPMVAAAVVVVLVTLEEVSQIWLPTRAFSLSDLAADYLGMSVGVLLARLRAQRGAPLPPSD